MSDIYDKNELVCNYCENQATCHCPYCESYFCKEHAKEFKKQCNNCRPELEDIPIY